MGNIKLLAKWIKLLKEGKDRGLAKLISLIEDYDMGEEISKQIFSMLGNSYFIGITGSPGVGKSTLTDKLVRLLRSKGKTVGIIAIDPTSPFSGGAILGDRIRLQKLATDSGVFIRSMASRGHLGGISAATIDAMKVMDAFGFDYVIIETVGVGQSEIEIVKHVDSTLLILIPGMGDDIQAMKAGVMEIGDIFVVNKADKDGVDRIITELETMQQMSPTAAKRIPIQKVIARDNKNIDELYERIIEHRIQMEESGEFAVNRKKRFEFELKHIVHSKLLTHTNNYLEDKIDIKQITEEIYQKKTDPYSVINRVITDIINIRN
ncbi:MAG: methylmalonyl Co-A mutase-associated GTPase MeaB [Candidatus Cloacimonadota bacterium]|nr:methylmalonyl Co-A mutase-associated GTPase MeaB [Candidatus Cloacimonadota bacterium]